jgi:hypothetical protein
MKISKNRADQLRELERVAIMLRVADLPDWLCLCYNIFSPVKLSPLSSSLKWTRFRPGRRQERKNLPARWRADKAGVWQHNRKGHSLRRICPMLQGGKAHTPAKLLYRMDRIIQSVQTSSVNYTLSVPIVKY